MNSQTSKQQTKAQPNKTTAESTENISAMTFPPFRFRQFRESRGCPRNARARSLEELGTMSKNRLRGITLVRGPVWGNYSLTLIISWCQLSSPFIPGIRLKAEDSCGIALSTYLLAFRMHGQSETKERGVFVFFSSARVDAVAQLPV